MSNIPDEVRDYLAQAGRKGGKTITQAKSEASRTNGARGGRKPYCPKCGYNSTKFLRTMPSGRLYECDCGHKFQITKPKGTKPKSKAS